MGFSGLMGVQSLKIYSYSGFAILLGANDNFMTLSYWFSD